MLFSTQDSKHFNDNLWNFVTNSNSFIEIPGEFHTFTFLCIFFIHTILRYFCVEIYESVIIYNIFKLLTNTN